MSAIKTLADLEKFLEKNNAPFEERDPVKWLKLDNNQTVEISFAQEIDPDSAGYDEDAGQVLVIVEHSNPENFRKKAACTAEEEGRCFGCEQHRVDPKAGWKGRARLYANVIVEDGENEAYLAVLSQGTSDKSVTPSLVMAAGEDGTITATKFKLKRNGTGTGTSYTLFPTKKKAVDKAAFSLYDLRKVATRDVPYAEQEAFYTGGVSDSAGEAAPAQEPSGVVW